MKKLKVAVALSLVALSTACASLRRPKIISSKAAVTEPQPLAPLGAAIEIASEPTFRNLTHPTISAYWSRRKADGEGRNPLNWLYSRPGLNWIPALDSSRTRLDDAARATKETACGEVHEASIFTGAGRTKEHDWGFVIRPVQRHLVDTVALRANADRVRHLPFVVEGLQAAKKFKTRFWYPDSSGYRLEVEVSPPDTLLHSAVNPFPCTRGQCKLKSKMLSGASEPLHVEPRRICAYGPWVQEALHGFRPEIHPAEAIYWRAEDGSWNLLMLQDASARFDARQTHNWMTPVRDSGGILLSEHWVQEAMVGEFIIPIDSPIGEAPQIVVIGEKGLEVIGAGDYPSSQIAARARPVTGIDSRLQAVVLADSASGRNALVVRAQIRGASHDTPFDNEGAFVLLRIAPATPSAVH